MMCVVAMFNIEYVSNISWKLWAIEL